MYGSICPKDGCTFSHPPERNTKVEEAISESNVRFSCCFASNGCPFELTVKDLKVHEELCGYKPTNCKVCQVRLKLKDCKEHEKVSTVGEKSIEHFLKVALERKFTHPQTGN